MYQSVHWKKTLLSSNGEQGFLRLNWEYSFKGLKLWIFDINRSYMISVSWPLQGQIDGAMAVRDEAGCHRRRHRLLTAIYWLKPEASSSKLTISRVLSVHLNVLIHQLACPPPPGSAQFSMSHQLISQDVIRPTSYKPTISQDKYAHTYHLTHTHDTCRASNFLLYFHIFHYCCSIKYINSMGNSRLCKRLPSTHTRHLPISAWNSVNLLNKLTISTTQPKAKSMAGNGFKQQDVFQLGSHSSFRSD